MSRTSRTLPRRRPLLLLAALALACAGERAATAPPATDAGPEALLARAQALAREHLIVDTHIDTPIRLHGQGAARDDVAERTSGGHFDAVRARAGGLDAAFFSIYVPASYQSGGARAFADGLIDLVEGLAAARPDVFTIATSPAEVRAIAAGGRIALALGMENGAPIEDLASLRHFAARGVRYITLTHSENNALCDSSYAKERRWNGLSPLGREVVAEMNRLGVLVDLAHVSDATFDQVLELCQAPPIVSHSSCRHFTPGFERNLDDARIVRLARAGGVLQINFGSAFLTRAANEESVGGREALAARLAELRLEPASAEARELRRQWRDQHPVPAVSAADVADHIEHAARLAGVDHVGLGSDFDGVSDLPVDLPDVAHYPVLVAELLRRGWSEGDIAKVLGLNLLRVWTEAERRATARGRG